MKTATKQNDGVFRKYHVPAVVRVIEILELLAQAPMGKGVSEIAAAIKRPKNSVFRICTTLSDLGYLAREEAGATYRLDRKLLSLGYAAVDESGLIEKAMDVLRELRDATTESAFIAVLARDTGVVLEQVPGIYPVKVTIQIGHHFPLHTAAAGKAMVAFLPDDERAALLGRLQLTRFNSNTITTRAAFERELAEVRRRGYAFDRAEEVAGIACVGAPVLNHRGYPCAGIWVAGPADRLRAKDMDRLGCLVKEHAGRISKRFGYAG